MASGVKLNGIEVKGIKFNGAILNIGGGGGSDTSSTEWQPHPDWWDIKTILENDTRDYAYKVIYLYINSTVESLLPCWTKTVQSRR